MNLESVYEEHCRKHGIRIAEVGDIWACNDSHILIQEITRSPSHYMNGEYTVLYLDTGKTATILSEIAERYAFNGWRFVA